MRPQQLPEQPPAILRDVLGALASGEHSSWTLEAIGPDTIRFTVPGDGRYRVHVQQERSGREAERPVAGWDPGTGVLTCPCGATSASDEIEFWAEETIRYHLLDVAAGVLLVDPTLHHDHHFVEDPGVDLRLGCTRCGSDLDFPDGVEWSWELPDAAADTSTAGTVTAAAGTHP